MLSHLSTKFATTRPAPAYHERRAAMFLNRYTRTLTIMYATDGLADVLGVTGDEMRGKSFYYCIQENCLQDAVRCLEHAKENDSIAYLRFWYRDPRLGDDEEPNAQAAQDEDSVMEDAPTSDEDRIPTGTARTPSMQHDQRENSNTSTDSEPNFSLNRGAGRHNMSTEEHLQPPQSNSRASSGDSNVSNSHEAVFGEPRPQYPSSSSSTSNSPLDNAPPAGTAHPIRQPIELEAVVSCTSDGLVVCLRRANPFIPQQARAEGERVSAPRGYENGLFAVPWSLEPMLPSPQQRAPKPAVSGFAPSLAPAQANHRPLAQPSEPTQNDFMDSIRDCAVFAWALVGINGSLANYSKGRPCGESQPASGLPVWQPEAEQPKQDPKAASRFPNTTGLRSSTAPSVFSPSDEASFDTKPDARSPQGYRTREGRPMHKFARTRAPTESAQEACGTESKEPPSDYLKQNAEDTFDGADGIGGPGLPSDYRRRNEDYHHDPRMVSPQRSSQSRSRPPFGRQEEVAGGVEGPGFPSDHKRRSPPAPSHMVDGVDNAFDEKPRRIRGSSDAGRSSSGFGFGDPGLNMAPISKLMNSSRPPSHLAPSQHNKQDAQGFGYTNGFGRDR